MAIQTVILAAGMGKRMHSKLPKVLHKLAGKPILEHVIRTAMLVDGAAPIVIYGHQGKELQDALTHLPARWIEQKEQLGTAHALLQALPELDDNNSVLVLYGDVPLITETTLKNLLTQTPRGKIGIVTANIADPFGYGRIKRNKAKKITGIVEEKDATVKERKILEINTGIYLIPVKFLKNSAKNQKRESARRILFT